MRYYLDTNILIFLSMGTLDELSNDVFAYINDYANTFMTSTVCVHEFIYLIQIGKIKESMASVKADNVIAKLNDMGIVIKAPTEKNLQVMAELTLFDDHRDPNDRLIIAQAISDKIAIISSDRKFMKYKSSGLDFVFNDRA